MFGDFLLYNISISNFNYLEFLNMNKFILSFSVMLVTLSVSPIVQAEETGTVPVEPKVMQEVKPRPVKALVEERKEIRQNVASTTKAIRTEAKDRIQDVKERMASTTEARKDRAEDMKNRIASSTQARKENAQERFSRIKEQLSKNFRNMLERIQATIERQERIMAKINTRIEKIKSEGGNTADAEKYVAEAKVNIDKSKVALETLKTSSTNAANNLSSTTVAVKKETMDKMREENKKITDGLKEAHRSLERAIASLKGLSRIKNPNATTTGATTTPIN